jgi:hypothetical protein
MKTAPRATKSRLRSLSRKLDNQDEDDMTALPDYYQDVAK